MGKEFDLTNLDLEGINSAGMRSIIAEAVDLKLNPPALQLDNSGHMFYDPPESVHRKQLPRYIQKLITWAKDPFVVNNGEDGYGFEIMIWQILRQYTQHYLALDTILTPPRLDFRDKHQGQRSADLLIGKWTSRDKTAFMPYVAVETKKLFDHVGDRQVQNVIPEMGCPVVSLTGSQLFGNRSSNVENALYRFGYNDDTFDTIADITQEIQVPLTRVISQQLNGFLQTEQINGWARYNAQNILRGLPSIQREP